MPFHAPIPEDKSQTGDGRRDSGGVASLVQAEKLMQIAFLLPCAMLIGWGAGWWLDHHFQMHWATIAGLVFGLIAGMVSVIRMALGAGNAPAKRDK
jgi:F0F1-type ATP synthase assembly protein I